MKEIKLGDLRPTRDFTYVKDIAEGFLAISECDDTIGKEINLSSNYEISMEDTVKLIKKILSSDAKIIMEDIRTRPSNSEVTRLWGNNSLVEELTGWKPKFSLESGMKETIRWFSEPENLKKYKAGIYNI